MNIFRHIDALIALSDECHFGRAANRLGMTQPALTRRIQALESELQIKLVERSTRSVKLTDSAARFVDRARDGFQRIGWAMQALKDESSGTRGHLRIGYNRISLQSIFVQIIRDYRTSFPDVAIDLLFVPSHKQNEDVLNGELELGFVVGDPEPVLGCINVQSLPLMVVVDEKHPLSDRKSVSVKELAGERFVLGNRNIWRTYHPIIEELCIQGGFAPNIVQEAATSEAVLAFVSSGIGISFYVEQPGNWPGLVYIPLIDSDAQIKSCLIWRRQSISTLVEQFLMIARRHVIS